MTNVWLLAKKENAKLCGFRIEGHSGKSVLGKDIVCAAISSAALMTANTITEILKVEPVINQDDGFLYLYVKGEIGNSLEVLLNGFKLHMEELAKEYPKNIKVSIAEV